MIGLRELTAGIAEYLAVRTGIAATNRRAESPVYPCLVVEANSRCAGIIACGRQVERQVTVTVTCAPFLPQKIAAPSRRREREAGLELADRVFDLLMAGFSACGRGFCPKEAEIAADEQERVRVKVLLEFYDLPETPVNVPTAIEKMGTLTRRMEQSKEEE